MVCLHMQVILTSALAATAWAATNSTPQALNTSDVNSISNNGGPVLYYNGSGNVPSYYEVSPSPAPITPYNSSSQIVQSFYTEILALANPNNTQIPNNCSACVAGSELLHFAAISLQVSDFTTLLINLCNAIPAFQDYIYADTCQAEFQPIANSSIPYSNGGAGVGAWWAQLFSKMSASTGDFTTYCNLNWDVCDLPGPIGIEEDLYFTSKPASASVAPAASGKTENVLHISDWHLDPRYDIGSEADCSQYLCCRPYSTNTKYNTNAQNATVPASRFGYLYCDSPPDLALSSFASMPQFFEMSNVSFTIFTGDIVSHDNDDQLSQAYIEYEEEVTYQTFKAQLGNIPVYATLGNHDSLPEAFNTQNALNPPNGTNALSWNYNLLSSLWLQNGWINQTTANYASTHYGAYAYDTPQGLRIISINTDFWYTDNIFNFWNVTNPDTSGVLTFLAQELLQAESVGKRVWIIGHVLSGYDGGNALNNPSALFYSIVVRFSPSTIAGVFFGHTHEDQLMIYYDFLPNSTYTVGGKTYRNTTMVDYSKPLQVGYIGPSITPLTGNNAGYQLYQVDASTFSVTGIQTYIANVSQSLTWTTPVWQFEYDTAKTYGPAVASVAGASVPAALSPQWWHDVTVSMLSNTSLVQEYNLLETKSAVGTKNCTSVACAQQKVCYIRSGSAALGRACPQDDGPF